MSGAAVHASVGRLHRRSLPRETRRSLLPFDSQFEQESRHHMRDVETLGGPEGNRTLDLLRDRETC